MIELDSDSSDDEGPGSTGEKMAREVPPQAETSNEVTATLKDVAGISSELEEIKKRIADKRQRLLELSHEKISLNKLRKHNQERAS